MPHEIVGKTICYGRSVPSIGEQLFGKDDKMSDEEKTKRAQKVYDSVLNAFPALRSLMTSAQAFARKHGYVETILGRRRHLPDMQLPEFEFKPAKGYVNPDIDPLNVDTLKQRDEIPERIVKQLEQEFKSYKYFGQIAKRTKELLQDEHIRVINNRRFITDATRQVVNSMVQGSAADQTKLAMLRICGNPEWKRIGGRLLVPVHDELIAEVPIDEWEYGGNLLSSMMCEAADFLPFGSKCDVTTTFRWYGQEYPYKFPKPKSIDTEDADEIKWIQFHLVEQEYLLPVYKEPDGSKPRGDASYGINGKRSEEMDSFILDYINRYNIPITEFLDHIEHVVMYGCLLESL